MKEAKATRDKTPARRTPDHTHIRKMGNGYQVQHTFDSEPGEEPMPQPKPAVFTKHSAMMTHVRQATAPTSADMTGTEPTGQES